MNKPKRVPGHRRSSKLELITKMELAKRMGVHRQTIQKWEEAGCPVAERGRRGYPTRYSELAVRVWREEQAARRAPDFLSARARKEFAQAIESEQRVAIRARKLLPVEDIERAWAMHVFAVRSHLLSWPAMLTDQLERAYTTEGLPGLEATLNSAVRQVLTELSSKGLPVPCPHCGGNLITPAGAAPINADTKGGDARR